MKQPVLISVFSFFLIFSFPACVKETPPAPATPPVVTVPHYWTELKFPDSSIKYVYDSTNRVMRVTANYSSGIPYITSDVTYNVNGKISGIGNVHFEYDMDGLLIKYYYDNNFVTITYNTAK